MSSMRGIGAARTADAPARIGEAMRADARASGGSFPEALGAAANSTDATETTTPSRHRADADEQDLPTSQTANKASQRHQMRRSSQGIGGLDPAFSLINTNPLDTPPAGRRTEGAVGSRADENSIGSVAVAPFIGEPRPPDLPTSPARPAIARDTSARATTTISFAQNQGVALDNPVTATAADPIHGSPAADSAGQPLPDTFALSLATSAASLAIGPDPDVLAQTLGRGASSVLGADVAAAPSRSASRGEEAPHPTTPRDQTVDASNILAGSGALGEVQVQGSSGSTASNSLPTSLADGLSYQVIRLVASGGQELVLRLHPPELGDLTVRVLVSGREVSAWFGSPQMQVQQAISQAIGQLHTDLGTAGYNLSAAWVGADAWGPSERDGSAAMPPQQRGAANTSTKEEVRTSSTTAIASGVSVYV